MERGEGRGERGEGRGERGEGRGERGEGRGRGGEVRERGEAEIKWDGIAYFGRSSVDYMAAIAERASQAGKSNQRRIVLHNSSTIWDLLHKFVLLLFIPLLFFIFLNTEEGWRWACKRNKKKRASDSLPGSFLLERNLQLTCSHLNAFQH